MLQAIVIIGTFNSGTSFGSITGSGSSSSLNFNMYNCTVNCVDYRLGKACIFNGTVEKLYPIGSGTQGHCSATVFSGRNCIKCLWSIRQFIYF